MSFTNVANSIRFLIITFGVLLTTSYVLSGLKTAVVTPVNQTHDVKSQSISAETVVSATVGISRFTLTGYTSPWADVYFEGRGIFAHTTANAVGFFIFSNRFSPLVPNEACLRAVDTFNRITTPVCLPPFPTKKDVHIGPIVLPPTMSSNQEIFTVDDYGILEGKGVPESTVSIDVYADSTVNPLKLDTTTDTDGDFSITLPTEHENTLRTHSINEFKDIESEKSHTLTFSILPFWLYVLRVLRGLLGLLANYMIAFILAAELIILLLLHILSKKKYPLVLRPKNILAKFTPGKNSDFSGAKRRD